MDIASIVGFIIAWAMILATMMSEGGIMTYYSLHALMIVCGGSLGAVILSFPLSTLLTAHKILFKAFFNKLTPIPEIINSFVTFAEVARRDGILSLESMIESIDDPFIVRGIQMAVDGTDPEIIESIMEADLESQIHRHHQGKAMFASIGNLAPAFGMVGTLIGLVAMMSHMENPDTIGHGLAVALTATMYGAIVANAMFLPLGEKLGAIAAEEILRKTVIIKGIMSIQAGDNPRIVEQKLLTYLPMAKRNSEARVTAKAA